MHKFETGDVVVYAKQKCSPCPGPRAKQIEAPAAGEQYSYVVHKFWRVAGRSQDGKLVLKTRRGKQHVVSERDPLLRQPSLLEKVLWRHKFPGLPQ